MVEGVLVGAGAGEVDEDAARGDFDVGAYLEEFEADGTAGGFGQLRTFKCDTAKRAHQDVGGGGEPQPQLVGAHGVGAGAVGEQIQLLFFDAVFHVAACAVVFFVEPLGLGVGLGQIGDDEAWVGAFGQVFGFGDDAA